MDTTILNLGSIGLGLSAWGLGIAAIVLGIKQHKMWPLLPFSSMACCALALCFQLINQGHLVERDLGALLDTAQGIAGIGMFLLATTLCVNVVAFTCGFWKKVINP